METTNLMKMFLAMGEMTQQTQEERVAYKERIVFATPGIIKPSNWESLSLDERLTRLEKIGQVR
tara:strand:- start:3331 stop:3522 length:192 start_codon:yes stop_codon:yes gene_type:complete